MQRKDLSQLVPSPRVLATVPMAIAEMYCMVPIKFGMMQEADREAPIEIAFRNSMTLGELADVSIELDRIMSGRRFIPAYASEETDIREAIGRYYKTKA